VRQDCSFAKKQASPPALVVVVQSGHVRESTHALAIKAKEKRVVPYFDSAVSARPTPWGQ